MYEYCFSKTQQEQDTLSKDSSFNQVTVLYFMQPLYISNLPYSLSEFHTLSAYENSATNTQSLDYWLQLNPHSFTPLAGEKIRI